jgi:hypothetical protein
MLRRSLCLLTLLYPFLVGAQKPTQLMAGAARMEINDDETYSPHLEHPAYLDNGPVVLLDEAHGNYHFDKAYAKLISTDGYQVVVSRSPFTFDELSKAKVLVIMNPGVFMSMAWHDNPKPLFSNVESAAVKDWVASGGSLLFASGSTKVETEEMLLNYLGVAFSHDVLSDRELIKPSALMQTRPAPGQPPAMPTELPVEQLAFTREKKMLATHIILAGRSEAERVDALAVGHASPILKAPDNAMVLVHCSDKAFLISRDALMKKQMAEAERALLSRTNTATTTPMVIAPVTPVSAPEVPVAVAFTLGKGRVVILGNSSLLTSVVQQSVRQDQPLSQKIGLGSADNQKFTLNIMHWLTGLLQ